MFQKLYNMLTSPNSKYKHEFVAVTFVNNPGCCTLKSHRATLHRCTLTVSGMSCRFVNSIQINIFLRSKAEISILTEGSRRQKNAGSSIVKGTKRPTEKCQSSRHVVCITLITRQYQVINTLVTRRPGIRK